MVSKINKSKIILTDVDEVLLDFTAGYHEFMINSDFHYPFSEKQEWRAYHDLGWSEEEKVKIMMDFAHSDYFKSIPAKECALSVIEDLKSDGWRFVAITSCLTGSEDQCYQTTHTNRMDNLERFFGNVF